MQYQIFGENGIKSAVTIVFSDGRNASLTGDHLNFDEIVNILTHPPVDEDNGYDEEYIYSLTRPALTAGAKLDGLSERVTYNDSNIFFDGDPIEGAEVNHIVRLIKEGKSANEYRPIVLFLEKIRQNPSQTSRDSLYEFLERHNFTITRDGDFIAYKGVKANGDSIHSGGAIVNGEVVKGHVPNSINSVIEMARSKVDDNTSNGCSTGLHAGTYEYANNFAQGLLLTVTINPRDVVSVPVDSNFQKIRTCRYIVTGTTEVEYTEPIWDDEDYYDDDYDEDNDNWDSDYNSHEDFDDRDDDEETVEDVVADAIASAATITFGYTKKNGEWKDVAGFIPENLKDGLVTGRNENGDYRSYKISKIEDIAINAVVNAVEEVTTPPVVLSKEEVVTDVIAPVVVAPTETVAEDKKIRFNLPWRKNN